VLDPEAVTFFRVSKLAHRRPERQCNPARYPKPCKRQTTPVTGRGYFFERFDGSPRAVFPAFAVGETALTQIF